MIAAAHFGALAGRNDVIAFDMGGTTAKAGVIENGDVRHRPRARRSAPASTCPVCCRAAAITSAPPTVDLAEVGAGGGSIVPARLPAVLKVGPESAGADPGPVATAIGGEGSTVTDANRHAGPHPGGSFPRRPHAARRGARAASAAATRSPTPLGLASDEACAAIIEVANASMLKMLRIVTVEKGLDPAASRSSRSAATGPVLRAPNSPTNSVCRGDHAAGAGAASARACCRRRALRLPAHLRRHGGRRRWCNSPP